MRRAILTALLLAVVIVPAGAQASQLIARDAKDVTLRVNARGQALVGYRAKGKQWTVLAWGATVLAFAAAGQAVGIELTIGQASLLAAGVALVTAIPAGPAPPSSLGSWSRSRKPPQARKRMS